MEKLSFKVNEYEGPLDVILALIAEHQLDIYDINISDLLEQYLGFIREIQNQQMEVASEFLEMASRLVKIKTHALLPHYEDEEDPKQVLIDQLLEYKNCKLAAEILRSRDCGFVTFIRKPMPIEIDPEYHGTHTINELSQWYWDAVGRGKRRLPPKDVIFTPLVTKRVVSVTSRIMHILRGLYKKSTLALSQLWDECEDRSELVASFMAVLELLHANRIHLDEGAETIQFLGRKKGE